ncbi:hypothetical protein GCM10010365_10320 [Streptomyces poonensis]|uniref:DNA-binding protein n=1 Tax=Streptomyces poonensis TaxID=68255 RepID=A0A918UCV4_9ACTN|nr:hypothetical protein GCM10010365_10320 [Streptomyces poonensis]GLJ87528.1 hypothetical protein GCM10017589_01280 [Streptomyces poonensis]
MERRRERVPAGQIRTRTYFYDVPGGDTPDDPPEPPKPRRPRKQPTAAAENPPAPTRREADPPAAPLTDADPQAIAVLTALRRVDPRLMLSQQEAARLAPAVGQWLAAGVGATQITDVLTTGLPDRFRARPAGILAFRLRETPLPAPPPLTQPVERPAVLPLRNCDGCDRAFRSATPGRCRDCRPEDRLGAAG